MSEFLSLYCRFASWRSGVSENKKALTPFTVFYVYNIAERRCMNALLNTGVLKYPAHKDRAIYYHIMGFIDGH